MIVTFLVISLVIAAIVFTAIALLVHHHNCSTKCLDNQDKM
jgi:Na+-transporting NADH:ubiquinone oxidoreductase subunit NqrF